MNVHFLAYLCHFCVYVITFALFYLWLHTNTKDFVMMEFAWSLFSVHFPTFGSSFWFFPFFYQYVVISYTLLADLLLISKTQYSLTHFIYFPMALSCMKSLTVVSIKSHISIFTFGFIFCGQMNMISLETRVLCVFFFLFSFDHFMDGQYEKWSTKRLQARQSCRCGWFSIMFWFVNVDAIFNRRRNWEHFHILLLKFPEISI